MRKSAFMLLAVLLNLTNGSNAHGESLTFGDWDFLGDGEICVIKHTYKNKSTLAISVDSSQRALYQITPQPVEGLEKGRAGIIVMANSSYISPVKINDAKSSVHHLRKQNWEGQKSNLLNSRRIETAMYNNDGKEVVNFSWPLGNGLKEALADLDKCRPDTQF